MRPGPHARRLSRNRRIVQEPKHAIAERHLLVKKPKRQAKMQGNGPQDLEAQLVKGAIKPADIGLKPFNFTWPDIGRHIGAIRMALG